MAILDMLIHIHAHQKANQMMEAANLAGSDTSKYETLNKIHDEAFEKEVERAREYIYQQYSDFDIDDINDKE